jgi:branched-chain amino acid aminotransferase
LKITQNPNPAVLPKGDLGYGKHLAGHMLEARWSKAKGWEAPQIVPTHDLVLDPLNSSIHYGFEGVGLLKVCKDAQGKLRAFRPNLFADLINRTSAEISFPSFDPAEFLKCIESLVSLDAAWVPDMPNWLHVRPTMISMVNQLGVHAPAETMLYVASTPVSHYFPDPNKPLRLWAESTGIHTWAGGCGETMVTARYGVGVKYVVEAKNKGYDHVLWLHGQNIVDTSPASVFFYWINPKNEKELVTAPLGGTIEPDAVRRSILELSQQGKICPAKEREIEIKELLRAHKEKRVRRFLVTPE